MKQSDFGEFTRAWAAAAEMQTGNELTDSAIKMAFVTLSEYDLIEVKHALLAHCKQSRWMATPADIIKQITGELPSVGVLYHLAIDDACMLGRYVRATVRGDITRLSQYDGLLKVEAISGKVVDFHARVLIGKYTTSELTMMVNAGHDPAGALSRGVPGPRLPYRNDVRRRAAMIEPPELLEPPVVDITPEQQERNKRQIEALLKTMGAQ